jgi:hypothetical protein
MVDADSLRRELRTMRSLLIHQYKIDGGDLALLGAIEATLRAIDGQVNQTNDSTLVEGICAKFGQLSADQSFTGDLLYGLRDVVMDLVGLLGTEWRAAMLIALDRTIAHLRDERGEGDDSPRMAMPLRFAELLRQSGGLRVIPGGKKTGRRASPPSGGRC